MRTSHPATRRIAAVASAAVPIAAVSVATASAGVRTFQSPSKNIGCVIFKAQHGDLGGARCDIAEHSWTAPPKPHSCDLDYGQGLEVGRHGKGGFVCAGDTTLHQGKVLPYGESIKFGGFKCKSNTTGVRCHNLDTRHGFSISRQRAVTF